MQDLTERQESHPRPINIWLESLRSQTISAREEPEAVSEAKAQKDEAILILLAKLALVYWRPDFTPMQAEQLYMQYLDDLREFSFKDIAWAIATYRRDPESKFYPSPGQLRGLLAKPYSWDPNPKNHMKERRAAAVEELQQTVSDPHLQLT